MGLLRRRASALMVGVSVFTTGAGATAAEAAKIENDHRVSEEIASAFDYGHRQHQTVTGGDGSNHERSRISSVRGRGNNHKSEDDNADRASRDDQAKINAKGAVKLFRKHAAASDSKNNEASTEDSHRRGSPIAVEQERGVGSAGENFVDGYASDTVENDFGSDGRSRGRGGLRMGEGRVSEEGERPRDKRHLSTSGGSDETLYTVMVTAESGNTSADWNGATWTMIVGIPVPGQSGQRSAKVAAGGIYEDFQEEVQTVTVSLERGCYIIFATAGTRPFDVIWSVTVDGEDVLGASGGGQDRHTFGVGGALCGLGTCYSQCYEEWQDFSTDVCPSYGDLLAPADEPAGANCACTADEELELRLTCLNTGLCNSISQCYLVDDAVSEVTTTSVIKVVTYVTVTQSSVDTLSAETALADWLNLDPSYVELTYVNGIAARASSRRRGRRRRLDKSDEMTDLVDLEKSTWGRNRQLQTEYQKRLEYEIIAPEATDRTDILDTIDAGVRGLNAIFAVQEEASGFQDAQGYTATAEVVEESVATADVPTVTISGTGSGGVDADGQLVVEPTSAPVEDSIDFTRSAQFIVGAGLVVVVSAFLSVVACIVCRMKRKERKAFIKKNAPVNGQPKPIEFVDPWGSVARDFTKDKKGSSDLGGPVHYIGSKGGGNGSNGNETQGGNLSSAANNGSGTQPQTTSSSRNGSGRPKTTV